jgi:ABC-type Fe3+/spermidine/putrescine transport system ATPase subunit
VGAQPGVGETVLALDRVSKRFSAEAAAVDSVSLSIRRGEVFTLLGPSGCGKTTTLRLVAGLERPDAGEITLRDRVVASAARRLFVVPNQRNLGMVFQSYAVWPHMTVFENVAYPLRLRGLGKAAVRDRVARVLDLVGLGGLEARPGTLLSGGQMQRLALCRALVYEPDLLLLDEPFSNLDAKLREQMRMEVKLLQRRLGITVLFVTHDQVEALSLSDRIAVMHGGRVEQVGTPRALYERPASAFVRDFLGQTVILSGRVATPASDEATGCVTVAMNGALAGCSLTGRNASPAALAPGSAATVAIRPEDIRVERDDAAPREAHHLLGTIDALSFVGDRYEARVSLGGEHGIVLLLTRAREWREGDRVRLGFPPELVSVWPA